MLEALIFKLRLRKPRALFALEQVLPLMWSSQLTVLFIVTPRYLADETFSRSCYQVVCVLGWERPVPGCRAVREQRLSVK